MSKYIDLSKDNGSYKIPYCPNCHVREHTVFKKCPEGILNKHLKSKRLITVPKNSTIFSEGAVADGVYCIYSGRIKIVKKDRDGSSKMIYLIEPGGMLGLHAIMHHEKVHATSAIALWTSKICFIPSKDFQDLINKDQRFSMHVLKYLAKRLEFHE